MARPPKLDDDEVLDRAIDAFWVNGWSATSIRDLERAVDLKAPSIYRRYGNKDGLARAVMERYIDRVIGARIARHLSGRGDPIANVAAFLSSGVTPASADEPLRGCLLTVTALESSTITAGLAELLADGLAQIEAALAAELARAEAAGTLAPALSTEAAASQLALAFQGLMVLARTGVAPAELQARVTLAIESITEPRTR